MTEQRSWLLIALVSVAIVAGGVAVAVPTNDVHRPGLFVNLGNAGNPVDPGFAKGPGAPMELRVGENTVNVQPPLGYSIVQVAEGDPKRAHVTLAPTGGPGDTLTVRFEVPDFVREGDVVGSHNGSPVYDTRFGLLWRSPSGQPVLVSGAGQSTQLELIDGLRVARSVR